VFVSREEEFERGALIFFFAFFSLLFVFFCVSSKIIRHHTINMCMMSTLLRINQSFHFLSSDEESAAFDARDAFFLGAFSDGDGDGSRGVAEFVDGFREDASDGEVFSGDSFG